MDVLWGRQGCPLVRVAVEVPPESSQTNQTAGAILKG